MTGGVRGLLITFEGLDGTGKTTQARMLAAYLRRLGLEVVHTHEPGGTRLGRRLRSLVLHGGELSPQAELLLLMADRAQHVAEVLRPALGRGAVVVCERFTDSSVAYQAYGLGMDRELVEQLNRLATADIVPDMTVLLDRPVHRRLGRPAPADRIEGRSPEFHRRVREGYLRLAGEEPQRFVVLPALEATRRQVHRQVVAELHRRLGARLAALLGAGGPTSAECGPGTPPGRRVAM